MSGETLESLAAEAATIGAAPADGAEPGTTAAPGTLAAPVESPAEANTRALCLLAAMIREATALPLIFDPPITTLARHLGDDKLQGLMAPWGRVLDHYGINIGAVLDDHPLTAAAFATGPALWLIGTELAAELRARRPPAGPLPVAPRVDPASGD